MTELTGRTVLITGATDGLGRALARQLANDGASLILHGRRRDVLEQTAEEVRGQRVEVSTVLADSPSSTRFARWPTISQREEAALTSW